MKVLIVGGGKVGYYLARALLEHDHHPVLIELSKQACETLANSLDVPVLCGDGTMLDVLRTAGAEECDALISVTGKDEDNLISCQLGKRVFQIPRTIAKVNNPKNAGALKQLGVDITINSTDNIVRLLEHEVDTANIKKLTAINHGEAAINEVVLPENYRLHGKKLSEISLPNMAVIISISREGHTLIPRGDTRLMSGDTVLFMAMNDALHQVTDILKLRD